jgi:regulator of sigma E protease
MNIRTILEFVVVLGSLIFLHELGHFLAAKFSKIEVEEFGFGLPPRALRFWRLKGTLTVGQHKLIIPSNFELPFDPQSALNRGVDVTARRMKDKLVLEAISLAATEDGQYLPTQSLLIEQLDGKIHFDGILHDVMQGTAFTLNWLPFGGFCRMKGENDPDVPGSFAAANPWKRIGVLIAGPIMNLLAAVVLYAVIVSQVGMPNTKVVEIMDIAPGSPAALAGIQTGDIILKVNDIDITSMDVLSQIVADNLGKEVTITLQHDGQNSTLSLTPRTDPPAGEGAMGIIMGNPSRQIDVIQAIPAGFIFTYEYGKALFGFVGQIIRGQADPEQARLVGFKGMYDMYSEVRTTETIDGIPPLVNVLFFVASITISLGLINLLPFPAVDGGRIVFVLPEILFHRRVPQNFENIVNMIGFGLLLLLLFYVNLQDFIHPITLP